MQEFLIILRNKIDDGYVCRFENMPKYMLLWSYWVDDLERSCRLICTSTLLQSAVTLYNDQKMQYLPFVHEHNEIKGIVSGFLIIKAKDMLEAISIAERCPNLSYAGSSIEVRQMISYP
jgi:hypothetical protein